LVISTIFDLMKMKKILYFILACFIFFANTEVSAQIKKDTLLKKDTLPVKRIDSSKAVRKKLNDTVRKSMPLADSIEMNRQEKTVTIDTIAKKDSSNYARKSPRVTSLQSKPSAPKSLIDTIIHKSAKDTSFLQVEGPLKIYGNIVNRLLLKNKFINSKAAPVFFIEQERNGTGKEFLFYALCVLVLILGIFKSFFHGYFNNLFRVFFNTSLRQTQLVDQLLQAKLPSFLLNIFFTLTAGFYIWLLFMNSHQPRLINGKLLLPFSILTVAVIYFIKYALLKFMGWVSDIQQATDNYIFVIFLVNKITGILLIPFIILLAFSMPQWRNPITTISLLVLGLFFLARYVKSYGVIENKIPLNPFHFIIYVAGAEILPLFIIYKVAMDYLI